MSSAVLFGGPVQEDDGTLGGAGSSLKSNRDIIPGVVAETHGGPLSSPVFFQETPTVFSNSDPSHPVTAAGWPTSRQQVLKSSTG